MYFDNAATTIHKPKEVGEKLSYAITSGKYGNPSRSGHVLSQNTMLAIYESKKELAKLVHIDNPSDIVFTSNASYALNFIIKSLIKENNHVITTTTEHNSVLRPLYQTGADLSFLDFDDNFELEYEKLPSLLKENTRFLVANSASNLLANVNDLDRLHSFSKANNLIMIVDLAQSLGLIDIDISRYDNCLFAFTGHKSLYGPSGTGGIIKNGDFDFENVFSGGSGVKSFAKDHPSDFPTVFEVGTANFISQIALKDGIQFVNEIGVDNIYKHIENLTRRFYDGAKKIPGIKFYSKQPDGKLISPIVSLNLPNLSSDELALILDEEYDIQTRPASHCAPLIHKHFGTENCGIVRFSFSYFNTIDEIDQAIKILWKIGENY